MGLHTGGSPNLFWRRYRMDLLKNSERMTKIVLKRGFGTTSCLQDWDF